MAKTTEKKLPTHIEEVDVLKYEKLALQMQTLDLQKQLLQGQMQSMMAEWNTKYSLSQNDQLDLSSREIKRAGNGSEEPEKK